MICYICAYLHERLWGLGISSRCLPHFTLFFEIRLLVNPEFPVFGRLAGLSPGVHLSLNPQGHDYRVTATTTTPDFYVKECWGSQELMLTHRVISLFLYCFNYDETRQMAGLSTHCWQWTCYFTAKWFLLLYLWEGNRCCSPQSQLCWMLNWPIWKQA